MNMELANSKKLGKEELLRCLIEKGQNLAYGSLLGMERGVAERELAETQDLLTRLVESGRLNGTEAQELGARLQQIVKTSGQVLDEQISQIIRQTFENLAKAADQALSNIERRVSAVDVADGHDALDVVEAPWFLRRRGICEQQTAEQRGAYRAPDSVRPIRGSAHGSVPPPAPDR